MKTIARFFIILGFILISPGLYTFSQVAISNDDSNADPSAMLEVKSTNKGFLPPRIELTSINSANPIVSPAIGLLVYNTANAGTSPNNVTPGFYYWNGTKWISIASPQGTNPGDILYWNGMQWVGIPLGSPGQFLQLSQSNMPEWSGAAFSSLTTIAASSITSTTASSGGNVTSDGGATITERGVCWSTSTNPTTANSKTIYGSGTGTFIISITGLSLGNTYYARAYSINSAGTSYGNEISFTTTLAIGESFQGGIIAYILQPGDPGYLEGETHFLIAAPSDVSTGVQWWNGSYIITGAAATAVGTGNANTNIIVAAQGAGNYAAKLCYDLVLNGYSDWYLPSKDELNKLYLNQVAIGGFADIANPTYWSSSEEGDFTASFQNFNTGQQIYNYKSYTGSYVRAVRAFPSVPIIPTVTTTSVSSITSTSATSGGNVTTDGGGIVTAYGVCWRTTSGPTTADSKTTDGSGTGSFASSLISLTQGTTYYVRAYATNSAGTAYGNELIFTTLTLPEVTTATITNITQTTATSGGNITSDGGATVTARGVCWNTSPNPVITGSHTTDDSGTGTFVSSLTGLTEGTLYYVRAYATSIAGTAYGNETSFTTSISDNDGNIYKTVTIGSQVWMAENLKTTKYKDETAIPLVTDNAAWSTLTTPGYCWYGNNEAAYKATYGAIYNWYTVSTGNLCPTGWHVPTDAEWTTLTTYLGGESVAGGKLKEAGTAHWSSPNTGATNETGFTALPGGSRSAFNGAFGYLGYEGTWWSYYTGGVWYRYMIYLNSYVVRDPSGPIYGWSVRCLKD